MNDVKKFRVQPETDRTAFLQHDPSATGGPTPCKVYLVVDTRTGETRIETRMSAENAVPMDVWYGVTKRVPIDPAVDAEALTHDINAGRFDDLLQRICDGTAVAWDGSNLWRSVSGRVGKSNEDALSAIDELEEALLDYVQDDVGLWSAADWLQYIDPAEEFGITPGTTDEEIEKIAARIEADALVDGAVVIDTEKYLAYVRDSICEDNE